jgi:hypothetical protein
MGPWHVSHVRMRVPHMSTHVPHSFIHVTPVAEAHLSNAGPFQTPLITPNNKLIKPTNKDNFLTCARMSLTWVHMVVTFTRACMYHMGMQVPYMSWFVHNKECCLFKHALDYNQSGQDGFKIMQL